MRAVVRRALGGNTVTVVSAVCFTMRSDLALAFLLLVVTAPTSAQDAVARALPPGVTYLSLEDVQTVFSALWDCPQLENEFAQHRCEQGLPEARRFARSQVFVAASPAAVGRYDFGQNRFPVEIGGLVLNDDPRGLRGTGPIRGPWDVNGLMMIGPSPLRPRASNLDPEAALPHDWLRLVTTHIDFSDSHAAEEWRAQGRERNLGALIVFRFARTWRMRVPPSFLDRAVERQMARVARAMGRPPFAGARATDQVIEGVAIRVLGWILVDADTSAMQLRVLAQGSLRAIASERRLVEATAAGLERLRPPQQLGGRPPVADRAEPVATTTPTQASVDDAVAALISEVRACAPDDHGRGQATLTFASNGSVTAVRIEQGPVEWIPAEACMSEVLFRVRVPPFSTETFSVLVPIVIASEP